ncbi:MAG: AAA family ATPase [Clostridiales bacterium]|nr:AAA family ATPase [Clostridiales bacterium]
MIIKSIDLENFRQFHGNQNIEFASDEGKHVTIIHGENGSGKTTLLEAFNWCFYGSANLEDINEFLLSKSVMLNMSINSSEYVRVKIVFLHQNCRYTMERSQKVIKVSDKRTKHSGNSITRLKKCPESGNEKYLDSSEINKIFPKKLSSYFLFDGERIKDIGNNNQIGRKELSEAVRGILGLDYLSNAIDHIGGKNANTGVIKMFRDELEELATGDLEILLKKQNFLESKIDTDLEIIENKNRECIKQEKEIETYENFLNKTKSSKENQTFKEKHDGFRKKALSNLDKEKKSFYSKFSSNQMINHFSIRIFDKALELLNEYETDVNVIDGVNIKAINHILSEGMCICGRAVEKNSEEYNHLDKLKKYLPPESYGVMINRFKSSVEKEKSNSGKCVNDLLNINDAISNYYNESEEEQKKVEKYEKLLENSNIEEISTAQKKLKIARERYRNAKEEITVKKINIVNNTKIINEIKTEIEEINKTSYEMEIITRRIKVAEELYSYIEDYYSDKETVLRKQLVDIVQENYDDMVKKDYSINIDENYVFEIIDKKGIRVRPSKGEAQITSLSFISGLVHLVKSTNSGITKKVEVDHKIDSYPMIMDSPFGALDKEYRDRVAKMVTRLAPQVILFASSTQWRGEVENAMKANVGAEYKIDYRKKYDSVGDQIDYSEIN